MKFYEDPLPINQSVAAYANLNMSVNEKKKNLIKNMVVNARANIFCMKV